MSTGTYLRIVEHQRRRTIYLEFHHFSFRSLSSVELIVLNTPLHEINNNVAIDHLILDNVKQKEQKRKKILTDKNCCPNQYSKSLKSYS